LEREPAARNAFALVAHDRHVPAAHRDLHAFEPAAQALAKQYFTAACPQCLRLQVDEDKAGAGAKWHADMDWLVAGSTLHSRLHDEAVAVASDLPAFVVQEPLVRQC